MKITALKSGKFAHPEPSKGNIELVKGGSVEVDDKMAGSMISDGWGEPYNADAVPVTEVPLNKMNKTELIKFAEKNAPDMDPTLKNADMVKFIQKALDEAA